MGGIMTRVTGIPEAFATGIADRYRVERELGAGGMATVYLASSANSAATSARRQRARLTLNLALVRAA